MSYRITELVTGAARLLCLAGGALMLLPATAHAASDTGTNAAAIEAGRLIADDRKRGNCYSCHAAVGVSMAGNAAPPFVQMKARFPDAALLRAQIVDPRIRNPNTIMPPYGAHAILTEQEIDSLVDYLLAL